MTTSIVKWKDLKIVNFKQPRKWDLDQTEIESLIISDETYEIIKPDIVNFKFFEINWELHNPYSVKNVLNYKMQEWAWDLITLEPEFIQKKVKQELKYQKKVWAVRMMRIIDKFREEASLKPLYSKET